MSEGTGTLSILYNGIINAVDKVVPNSLQPLWQSPAGPRTVFFWAPLFKWALVLAGLGDIITRPPELISLRQCGIVAATGLIWSRYSMVIIPKNYTLCSVNIFVFLTQSLLAYRAIRYQYFNIEPKQSFHENVKPYDITSAKYDRTSTEDLMVNLIWMR